MVNLPGAYDDYELFWQELDDTASAERFTSMSYFLARVRLAHLCREIVDIVPPRIHSFQPMPYETIIALDQKLLEFLSSPPFFFRLDAASRQRAKSLEAVNPNLARLRYCITNAAHSRRWKLHQRYMLRQSLDPRYAYSRNACLESARSVMQLQDGLGSPDEAYAITARISLAMHYMHLAMVVLIVDVCFNKGATDAADIQAEVGAALKMFEMDNRTHNSRLLQRFLSSSQEMLRKHKVLLVDVEGMGVTSPEPRLTLDSTGGTGGFVGNDWDMDRPASDRDGLETVSNLDFDQFWQSTLDGELTSDPGVWDSLFSAMDTRFL